MSAASFAVFVVVLERNSRRVSPTMAIAVGMAVACTLSLATDPGGVARAFSDPAIAPFAPLLGLTAALWSLLIAFGLGTTNALTTSIVNA